MMGSKKRFEYWVHDYTQALLQKIYLINDTLNLSVYKTLMPALAAREINAEVERLHKHLLTNFPLHFRK